jgi:hypothetical protein
MKLSPQSLWMELFAKEEKTGQFRRRDKSNPKTLKHLYQQTHYFAHISVFRYSNTAKINNNLS